MVLISLYAMQVREVVGGEDMTSSLGRLIELFGSGDQYDMPKFCNHAIDEMITDLHCNNSIDEMI